MTFLTIVLRENYHKIPAVFIFREIVFETVLSDENYITGKSILFKCFSFKKNMLTSKVIFGYISRVQLER